MATLDSYAYWVQACLLVVEGVLVGGVGVVFLRLVLRFIWWLAHGMGSDLE